MELVPSPGGGGGGTGPPRGKYGRAVPTRVVLAGLMRARSARALLQPNLPHGFSTTHGVTAHSMNKDACSRHRCIFWKRFFFFETCRRHPKCGAASVGDEKRATAATSVASAAVAESVSIDIVTRRDTHRLFAMVTSDKTAHAARLSEAPMTDARLHSIQGHSLESWAVHGLYSSCCPWRRDTVTASTTFILVPFGANSRSYPAASSAGCAIALRPCASRRSECFLS